MMCLLVTKISLKKGAFIELPMVDRIYSLRDFEMNGKDGNTLVFGMDC